MATLTEAQLAHLNQRWHMIKEMSEDLSELLRPGETLIIEQHGSITLEDSGRQVAFTGSALASKIYHRIKPDQRQYGTAVV